jgi:tRNA uridine 5-carboxymethylaminomethyl modification enzyme
MIVVGGGHAGTEAALAAARMGCAYAAAQCGTTSKPRPDELQPQHRWHRQGPGEEVDAPRRRHGAGHRRGGIQFAFSTAQHPAVRATRAQAERVPYKVMIRRTLRPAPNLWLSQQAWTIYEATACVVTQIGIQFRSRTVVLTAGTFLDGKIHRNHHAAGRADPSAISPARSAERAFAAKAGPRPAPPASTAAASTIQNAPSSLRRYARMNAVVPVFIMVAHGGVDMRSARCRAGSLHTNARIASTSSAPSDRSPMFTGKIDERACASSSVEDKSTASPTKTVTRFFSGSLEGLTTHEVLPLTASRPACRLTFSSSWCAQHGGLENAHILRPGYVPNTTFSSLIRARF